MQSPTQPLLAVDRLEIVYNDAILALRGASFAVAPGQVAVLLGANGAGKTTALRAVSNLLRAARGRIVGGTVRFDGQSTAQASPTTLVRHGLVQVLEGRRCFAQLTVEENLIAGALAHRLGRRGIREGVERIYGYFPRLKERRSLRAGYLSGGEQQMLALGRALIGNPRLLVLDEPSMGLAPLVVEEIFAAIRRLNRDHGLTILVAEQNAALALRYADIGYIIENGRVVLGGPVAELAARADLEELYFGFAASAARYTDWRPAPERHWLDAAP